MKTLSIIPFLFVISVALNFLSTKQVGVNSNTSGIVTPPEIFSPTPNSIIEDECSFLWTMPGDNLVYELWVSDNINFNNCERYVTRDTYYNCSLGKATNQYKYAKVRAWRSIYSYSEWSTVIVISHSEIAVPVDIIGPSGCSGNCANCPNPCGGRRRVPTDY